MFAGAILTHGEVDQVERLVERGQWSALKVVSAWGIGRTWSTLTRARICSATPATIVRTKAGDPASGSPWLHDRDVVVELTPWYELKPRIWIELGNEPNTDRTIDPWGYRWHLQRAIDACRAALPRARLIAPAMSLQLDNAREWMEILHDQLIRCDAVGLHVYDETGPIVGSVQWYRAIAWAEAFAPGRPRVLSEFGIHRAGADRGRNYAALLNSLQRGAGGPWYGATAYHICSDGAVDRVYALDEPTVDAMSAALPTLIS